MDRSPRGAVVLVSLGSARFTDANCRRLVDAAQQLEARELTCVLLDTLELTNLRTLFGLSGTEAADVVTERVVRVSALLRNGPGPTRQFVRFGELLTRLPSFVERRRTIEDVYKHTESFANVVHNQTFRNLHPVLKRLGIRNSRSPIVKELAAYLLEELALRLAIAAHGAWSTELSFTDDSSEITSALHSYGTGEETLAFLPITLIEPLTSTGVNLDAVTFAYPNSKSLAVSGCSLRCPASEIVGVLGKSGSGKSTLLKLIAGHLTPASGAITISGKSVAGLPPHQRGIATVFQDFALFPHLTIRENVAFGLEANLLYTASDVDTITSILLRRFDLEALADRLPKDISGGQRQRTAIARALASAPTVLLLDEPTASLDFEGRDDLVNVLWHLISVPPAPTILLVSHDRQFVLEIAAHLVVINDGRIVAAGPAVDLAGRPPDSVVAGIVGSHLLVPLSGSDSAVDCSASPTGNDTYPVALVRENDLSIRIDGGPTDSAHRGEICQGVAGRVIAVTAGASGVRIIVRIGSRDLRIRVPHASVIDRLEPGFNVRLSFSRDNAQFFDSLQKG